MAEFAQTKGCCFPWGRVLVKTWHHLKNPLTADTGSPSSLHERGRDSWLRAVLCYKRLFTKACMGCKRFFLKERKNVMFLNKIDVPYCLVVFFVVCPRLRPFWSVFGELALFWCSSLFLDQSDARTAEKKNFETSSPPLISGSGWLRPNPSHRAFGCFSCKRFWKQDSKERF